MPDNLKKKIAEKLDDKSKKDLKGKIQSALNAVQKDGVDPKAAAKKFGLNNQQAKTLSAVAKRNEEVEEEIEVDDDLLEEFITEARQTKFQMVSAVIDRLGGMKHEDLVKYHGDLFAEEDDEEDSEDDEEDSDDDKKKKGGKPKKGVNPFAKKDVKEAIEQIFSGSELTEDMQERTSVLFEAAVNQQVISEVERIETDLTEQLDKSVATLTETMVESVDRYLTHVAEAWIEDNEPVVDHNLKVDVAEELIEDLKEVLGKYKVFVPAEDVDAVAELEAKVDTLETRINEEVDATISAKAKVTELETNAVLAELSDDLADTDAERLAKLAEGIEFTDSDEYRKKITIVKENYFPKETSNSADLTEEFVETEEEDKKPTSNDPDVRAVSENISKMFSN